MALGLSWFFEMIELAVRQTEKDEEAGQGLKTNPVDSDTGWNMIQQMRRGMSGVIL